MCVSERGAGDSYAHALSCTRSHALCGLILWPFRKVVPDRYRGMSEDEIAAVRQQQLQQAEEEAEKKAQLQEEEKVRVCVRVLVREPFFLCKQWFVCVSDMHFCC